MVTAKNAKKNNIIMNSSNHYCHDCNRGIKVENSEIQNGLLIKYREGNEEFDIFKCDDCFKKNPALANFRKCEVYSRIVGYLRPVKQWNVGKKQEFDERQGYNFKIK